MKKLLLILIALLITVETPAKPNISINDIQSLVEYIKVCKENRDTKKLSTILSKDLKVRLNFPKEFGGRVFLNKDDYINQLNRGWSLPLEYKYEIKGLSCSISKDRKSAIVKVRIIETTVDNGKTLIEISSDEILEIVYERGVLKIKNIIGQVNLKK